DGFVILDSHWYAVQRPDGLAFGQGLVSCPRHIHRPFCGDIGAPIQPGLEPRDAIENCARDLDARQLLASDCVGEFGRRRESEIGFVHGTKSVARQKGDQAATAAASAAAAKPCSAASSASAMLSSVWAAQRNML